MTSQIRDFYKNQSVFLTGGTGFLGMTLIEKLLRSTEVSKIYVLMRAKRGKDAQTRLLEMLDNVLYDKLKSEKPSFIDRVVGLEGDCTLENLGLSGSDLEKLVSDVNIVFHNAATIRMDENIKTAYSINVKGTENLLNLCAKIQNLKSFVHVSTGYSNCHLQHIDEIFYDVPIKYDKLEALLSILSQNEAKQMTSTILEKRHNTYTFTKALAEDLIKDTAANLPVGIFRPTGVCSIYREPLELWTDSFGGPNVIITSMALGLIRVFPSHKVAYADVVPVDLTIAALIATAWDVYNRRKDRVDIPIYNYSSVDNPISYSELFEFITSQFPHYPSKNLIWAPKVHFMEHSALYFLLRILYNYVPAFLMDFLRIICFKKPRVVSRVKKVQNICDILSPFSKRSWTFTNKNIKEMWNKIDEDERKVFNFNTSTVQWIHYLRNYWKGLRQYLLKEDPSSLPEAKIKLRRLEIAHNLVLFVGYFIVMNLIWTIFLKIFS